MTVDRDEATVVALARQACLRHADRVAIRAEDGTRTFAETWAAAQAVAVDLRHRGVVPGEFVGIWAVKTTDLLAGVLGILAAGAAYVPLDPTYPFERLTYMVDDARPGVIVAAAQFSKEAERLGVAVAEVEWSSHGSSVILPVVDPASPAYLIYTSGSTGRPKGVVVEHRSVVNLLDGMAEDLRVGPGDVFLGTAPIAFDASVPNLLLPLVTGATLCLPSAQAATDPHAIAALVDELHVDVLKCSNSVLRMLCAIGWTGRPDIKVVTGGESLPRAVAQTLLPRVGELWNYYGPTEASVSATRARVVAGDTDPVPIGWAMPGVDYLVVDRDLRPVQAGLVGELWICGVGVARGYLNDGGRTADKFVELSLVAGGDPVRGYRTGDMVRERADGALVMFGRVDDQVKLRGFRIELAEIETRLCEHPDVLQAVTVLNRNGRGDVHLVAFVQALTTSLDTEDVKDFAGRLLPAYMVPSLVVHLDRFPLTSGGKIDRQALSERDVSGARTGAAPLITDPLQRRVAELFATVLDLPVDDIGAEADFFSLGGQSIRAVELMGLVARDLRARLPLSTLMTCSTVRALARAVNECLDGVVRGPLVKLKEGVGTPLFLVHDATGELLAFQELVAMLPSSQPVYGLQMVGVDRAVPAMHDLDEIVDRYLLEIDVVWPDGPYLLAGFSFGGLIAYLMAVRLAEQGRQATLVALLDTGPPRPLMKAHPTIRPVTKGPTRDRRPRSERVRQRARDAMDLVRDRTWRVIAVRLWVKRDRVLPRILHNPGRVLMSSLSDWDSFPEYDGRVVQWWGVHGENVSVERMTDLWNSVVRGGIEVRVISGDDISHTRFLEGRSGRWMADGLTEEIARSLPAHQGR